MDIFQTQTVYVVPEEHGVFPNPGEAITTGGFFQQMVMLATVQAHIALADDGDVGLLVLQGKAFAGVPVGEHIIIDTGFLHHVAIIQNQRKIAGQTDRAADPPFHGIRASIISGNRNLTTAVFCGGINGILDGCAVAISKILDVVYVQYQAAQLLLPYFTTVRRETQS